ncbi:MAG: hypothetical protein FWE61_10280 [Micrococcales bacterium]|nr:hypothetical protein [Micrococcales bacterium]
MSDLFEQRRGPLLRDFQSHTLREILIYFRDGTHDEELDASFLHAVDEADETYTLGHEFFLLPGIDGDDEEIEVFAAEHDIDPDAGYLGQHLVDVLSVAREKFDGYGGRYVLENGRDHTLQELADAFNYYLEHDAFLVPPAEAG